MTTTDTTDTTESQAGHSDTAPIERRLLEEVITPIVQVGPEDRDRDLIELGLDSMALVHVLAQSEDLFDIELTPIELWEGTDAGISVALIATMIARARAEAQGDDDR